MMTDLTRALRPGFGNALKKGEGVGGGAINTVTKERAIGTEEIRSQSPIATKQAPQVRPTMMQQLGESMNTRVNKDLNQIS